VSYRDLEATGVFFVVARMSIRFRRPARYDDEVEVTAHVARSAGVKIDHTYEVRRGGELLATAETTLACVDGSGRVRPIPAELLP